MHRTKSKFNQSNKQLEEEKSCLVTALKLIKNDISNLHIENTTSGNKLDDSNNIIDWDITSPFAVTSKSVKKTIKHVLELKYFNRNYNILTRWVQIRKVLTP